MAMVGGLVKEAVSVVRVAAAVTMGGSTAAAASLETEDGKAVLAPRVAVEVGEAAMARVAAGVGCMGLEGVTSVAAWVMASEAGVVASEERTATAEHEGGGESRGMVTAGEVVWGEGYVAATPAVAEVPMAAVENGVERMAGVAGVVEMGEVVGMGEEAGSKGAAMARGEVEVGVAISAEKVQRVATEAAAASKAGVGPTAV